jgi:hypothetical protein
VGAILIAVGLATTDESFAAARAPPIAEAALAPSVDLDVSDPRPEDVGDPPFTRPKPALNVLGTLGALSPRMMRPSEGRAPVS